MSEYAVMSLMALGTVLIFFRLWNVTGRSWDQLQVIARNFRGGSIRPLVVLEGSIYHRVLRLMGVTALNTFAMMGLMAMLSLQGSFDWWWMLTGIVSFILCEVVIIELFRISRRRKYAVDLHLCERVLRATTCQGRSTSVTPFRRMG